MLYYDIFLHVCNTFSPFLPPCFPLLTSSHVWFCFFQPAPFPPRCLLKFGFAWCFGNPVIFTEVADRTLSFVSPSATQQGKGLRLLQLAWTACRSSGRGGPCITALTTASTATVQRNRPPLHCSHSREGSLIGVPEALKMCSPLWSDTLPGIYSEEITRNKTSNLYERLPSCIYL